MAKIARRTGDRFEIEQDGHTSYLAYEADGQGWISLLYTEVAEPLRGQGIAKDLARMAFEYAKENHLKVEVVCPVAFHVALNHPEYKSLVSIGTNNDLCAGFLESGFPGC